MAERRRSVRFLFLLLLAGCADDSRSPPASREEAWNQDLDALARTLKAEHGDLHHELSASDFEHALAALRNALPAMDDRETFIEIARLVALVGDGHTQVPLVTEVTRFHVLPIRLYPFADGFHVIGSTPEFAHTLGSRVTRIGGHDPAHVMSEIAAIVSRSNAQQLTNFVDYLVCPEILHAFGFAPSIEQVGLTLRSKGGVEQEVILPATYEDPGPFYIPLAPERFRRGGRWVSALDDALPLPLYLQNGTRNYGYAWIPAARTVYFQLIACLEAPDPPFATFFAELMRFIETQGAERLVIDLRFNNGGNFFVAKHHLEGLRGHRLDHPDGLRVLIGPRTFSAAIVNATQLRAHTRAQFYGEEVGDTLDFYFDTGSFRLPNSRLWVQYGRGAPLFPGLGAPAFLPDREVGLGSADYLAGRDPVLEAALR